MIHQNPNWENKNKLQNILNQIQNYPNLVSVDEINILKTYLADASKGKGFIIQGGDCAETFNDFKADSIRDKLKILLQMSVVLTYGASCNVVNSSQVT